MPTGWLRCTRSITLGKAEVTAEQLGRVDVDCGWLLSAV
jgi:hypothetical protein